MSKCEIYGLKLKWLELRSAFPRVLGSTHGSVLFTLIRLNIYLMLIRGINPTSRTSIYCGSSCELKGGNRVQEAPFALSPYSGTGYCVGHVFISKVGWRKETRHPTFEINTILHRPVPGKEGARAAWPAFWVK